MWKFVKILKYLSSSALDLYFLMCMELNLRRPFLLPPSSPYNNHSFVGLCNLQFYIFKYRLGRHYKKWNKRMN